MDSYRYISPLLLLFFLFPSFAQEKVYDAGYECVYSYRVLTNGKSMTSSSVIKDKKTGEAFSSMDPGKDGVYDTYYLMLQTNGLISKTQDILNYSRDSLFVARQNMSQEAYERKARKLEIKIEKSLFYYEPVVYQDNGTITVEDFLVPDYVTYNELSAAFVWRILPDTLTVCGHLCQRGETSYGGRLWDVWFCPGIPITSGPWKFNGLPGLILAAQDSQGIHSFTAISFKKSSVPILKKKDNHFERTTREKYVARKRAYDADLFKAAPLSSLQSLSVDRSGGSAKIYFDGKRVRLSGHQKESIELK